MDYNYEVQYVQGPKVYTLYCEIILYVKTVTEHHVAYLIEYSFNIFPTDVHQGTSWQPALIV